METSAVTREVLKGGDFRLKAGAGAFYFHRIAPAVLLASFRGRDTGEFGTAALDVIAQEHRLFGKPVEWYFDASEVDHTSRSVGEEWTGWLRSNRAAIAKMHVLTAKGETHLRISVARHFSQTLKEMVLYTDRSRWQRDLPGDVADRFNEPALDVLIVRSRTQGVTLSSPGSQWTFRSLANNIVFTTFKGDDDGSLTDLALAELHKLVDASRGKVTWFLDLREARNVATSVSQIWTAWMTAHLDRLSRVSAVSQAPLFPLVLTVAKYRLGAERLFHIHRELQPFRDELVALTSPELAKAVGV